MKKRILLFWGLSMLVTSLLIAQPPEMTMSKMIDGQKYTISTKSIVKDTEGKAVAYENWMPMLRSGEYDLKPVPLKEGGVQEFIIAKLSEEEIAKRKASMQAQAKTKAANTINLGGRLRGFSFKDINGKQYDSSSIKGKVVLFNYWFIDCAPCVKEMPELNEMVKKFAGKDVMFFAVTSIDNKEAVAAFLKKKPFNFIMISKEEASNLHLTAGIGSYPSNVIVDKRGVIKYYSTSYTEDGIQNVTNIIESDL